MKTAAVYCGSFNPMHSGHLDVAIKAKSIFNDVFIVQAKNSDKNANQVELPKKKLEAYGFRWAELEPGDLLPDFVTRVENGKSEWYGAYSQYDSVCVIRGLRNVNDFTYEENLGEAYRQFKPNINIVYIMANPVLNFVSSSLLRNHGHLPQFKHLIV